MSILNVSILTTADWKYDSKVEVIPTHSHLSYSKNNSFLSWSPSIYDESFNTVGNTY